MDKYVAIKEKAREISDYAERLYYATNIYKDYVTSEHIKMLEQLLRNSVMELYKLAGV